MQQKHDPTIRIFEDGTALSRYAAASFVAAAHTAIMERGVFSVALSGGGTPQQFYELLASPLYNVQINWTQVHLFWGDERVVPPDADGSNFKQFKEAVIDRVAIPVENIHRVRGELEAQAAADEYARQLATFADRHGASDERKWPQIDLMLLGLGSDGHTASLFPYTPIVADSATLAVTADYGGRPAQRVTLTEAVINDARQIWFMIKGAGKAAIVQEVVQGERDLERLPGQRIRPKNGKLTFLLDKPAAANLSDNR
ncbi:MAG: 6-phosphogluconolactonase [Candidatus Promineifilaceae bacterium]